MEYSAVFSKTPINSNSTVSLFMESIDPTMNKVFLERVRLSQEDAFIVGEEEEVVSSLITQYVQGKPIFQRPGDDPKIRNFAMRWKHIMRILENLRLQKEVTDMELIKRLVCARAKRQFYLWLIFPINDLPAEILAHIFSFMLLPVSSKSATANRLLFSSICRHWRNIALGIPSLWSNVLFHDRPLFLYSAHSLNHARFATLDLTVDLTDDNWNGNEDMQTIESSHMTSLIDLIIPRLPKIRRFSLQVDTWMHMMIALNRFQDGPVPERLEFLELYKTGSPYAILSGHPHLALPPTVLFGGEAPLLKHLRLIAVHIDWERSPLCNLHTLELSHIAQEVSPTLSQFRAMLVNAPNIQVVHFNNSAPQWTVEELRSWSKPTLPQLRSLTLSQITMVFVRLILTLLDTPKLVVLNLNDIAGGGPTNFTTILRLTTNTFPELRALALRLEIEESEETKIALREWLKSMPKLKLIKISTKVPNCFFDALIPNRTLQQPEQIEGNSSMTVAESVPCPLLKELAITEPIFEKVARFVQGRKELGYPLKLIMIPRDNVPEVEIRQYRSLPGVLLVPSNCQIRIDGQYLL